MFPNLFAGIQPPMSPFMAATAMNQPMFSTAPPPLYGPFAAMGPIGEMIMPMLNSAFGDAGFLPAQFHPAQGFYDQLRGREALRQRQAAIAAGAEIDRTRQIQILRAAARRMGRPWGREQEALAQQNAANMSFITQIGAQFAPGAMDALHGSRGSAAVFAMGLSNAARFMIDPVTGQRGLSADTIRSMSAATSDLYNTPEGIRQMQGMGMGRAGMLLEEMNRRGMVERGIGTLSRDEQRRQLATGMVQSGEADSQATALRMLDRLDKSQFDERLRRFDSRRMSDRLKNMAGAVAAMSDIFGEMGQPDAPMSQILAGLDALTQGGLSTMPPGQIEKIVRETKALADKTGLSIDAISALTAQATIITDQRGLERPLAVQSGQHAAAFGQAYNDLRQGNIWGSMGRDKATAMDARLTASATGSEMANRTGAFLRMIRAFGVGNDTRASKLAEAIRRGDTTFEGRDMSDVLQNQNLSQIMQQSGMSANAQQAFQNSLRDTFGNQLEIHNNNLGSFVRGLQSGDWTRNIGRGAAQAAISSALRTSNVDNRTATRLAQSMSADLARAFLEEDFDPNDPDARKKVTRRVVEQRLRAAGVAPTDALITQISEDSYSNMNAYSGRRGGQGDLIKDREMYSRRMQRGARDVQKEAAKDAARQKRMSGLGRQQLIPRVIDMLTAQPDMSIREALSRALGGVDINEIAPEDIAAVEAAAGQRFPDRTKTAEGTGTAVPGGQTPPPVTSGTGTVGAKAQKTSDKVPAPPEDQPAAAGRRANAPMRIAGTLTIRRDGSAGLDAQETRIGHNDISSSGTELV